MASPCACPPPNVSVVDLVVTLKKDVTAESVNKAIKDAAESGLKGYLQYSEKPLVSIDFCGNKVSSIVDADLTMIVGERMVKVLAWYDNEWGLQQPPGRARYSRSKKAPSSC
jgi:glyceraldehyde 3-phosphate dehydrogenase